MATVFWQAQTARELGGTVDEGLYESVVTTMVAQQLDRLVEREAHLAKVDPADQAQVLTRYLTEVIRRRLEAEKDPGRKLALANDLLVAVDQTTAAVVDPLRELHAIRRPPAPGYIQRYGKRPKTPLNDAALLTNAHGEPSLAAELKAEIDSADSVDLLCAFVMWRGLRLLEIPLRAGQGRRRSDPRRHDDLHRRDGTRGPRSPGSRLRRRGEGSVRRRAHPPPREGVAVPTEHRVRHRVRRIVESLHERAPRRRRVECSPVATGNARPASEVRSDVRHLLERLGVRDVRPRARPRPAR